MCLFHLSKKPWLHNECVHTQEKDTHGQTPIHFKSSFAPVEQVVAEAHAGVTPTPSAKQKLAAPALAKLSVRGKFTGVVLSGTSGLSQGAPSAV